jgi:MFS family permease
MTSTSSTCAPRTARWRRSGAALTGTAILAVVAAGTALLLGPTEGYALIFPPPWVTFLAVGLLVAARLAPRGRAGTILGWAAAIFFLGGSGGVVLDAFRAFFWATGMPAGDFASVDWPGAAARAVSLLAAVVTVHHTWRHADAPKVADPESSARTRKLLTGAAAVLVAPYPLLKLVLWVRAVGDPSPAEHGTFPTMELVAFGAAFVLVLLMLSSRTPRALARVLVAGGWGASMVLLSMGFLMVFGMLAQLTGVAEGAVPFSSDGATLMVLCVYGTWLMLGVVVLAATLRLMDREVLDRGGMDRGGMDRQVTHRQLMGRRGRAE